jgi:MYXO-CTERM domain-containing protein
MGPLPTNARLLVYGTVDVRDAAGAEVTWTAEPGPEGATWITAPWVAGATYTLTLDGREQPIVIGPGPDDTPPAATWSAVAGGFELCDATLPTIDIVAADPTDDQTPSQDLFLDVRVHGAPDSDARVFSNEFEVTVTPPSEDRCFPVLPKSAYGDTVELDVRLYDLAGNEGPITTLGPLKLTVDDPDHGWMDDSGGCGCSPVGDRAPVGAAVLAGLALLRGRRASPR